MINIQNKVDCCGCNACGDICPKGAIIFAQDDEGFLYPKVDAYKCINCGLCENTCPQIHHADIKHNEFDKPKITAAIHKNYAIRFDSTSGGVFSALAKVIYSQGGFVGGAVWTEDWEIRQVVTDKRSDLPKLRSSKYAQSDARGFYSVVKSALGSGKPVMVCGTPCQMAALRLFVGKEYPNLYILDFICRGNNTPLLMKKYIEHHEQEAGGKLVSIKFKNKELGWRNLTKKMVFDNGKIMWDTKDRSLFSACYHKCHVFCRPSCYECKCKGIPFVSDITLGDCWVKKGVLKPEMDYDLGTSVVLINNSKGEMLFNQAAKSMLLQEIPWEAFLDGNRMFDKSIPVPEYDRDSHQHHFSETPVFARCGMRAVGTNESNTYRRTERENTVLRSANQYSRTQPITCRKWRFLNCRGSVGSLKNGFSAIHTDTNVGILDNNICGMTHFSEWQSILTNIGIQANTTGF